MTNFSVRNELLDIFEDLSEKINEGTYLKAMNLLGRIKIEEQSRSYYVDGGLLETMWLNQTEHLEPLGSRVIGENYLVPRPGMTHPILNAEECAYLLHKFETDERWRKMINKEQDYIFNKETMRFVYRASPKGKEIIKRCTLQQFPDIYTVNPRTGKLAIRRIE